MAMDNDTRGWIMTVSSGIGMTTLPPPNAHTTRRLQLDSLHARGINHLRRFDHLPDTWPKKLQNPGQQCVSIFIFKP
jgi:hypothetical protein